MMDTRGRVGEVGWGEDIAVPGNDANHVPIKPLPRKTHPKLCFFSEMFLYYCMHACQLQRKTDFAPDFSRRRDIFAFSVGFLT